jgi:hypothetical protein
VNRRKLQAWLLLLLWSCFLPASWVYGAQQADKREVVKQATLSYYNLRRFGFSGFKVKVQPNWPVVAPLMHRPEDMRVLNGLSVSLAMSDAGKVSIQHETKIPPPNAEAEQFINSVFIGMDSLLPIVFATWNSFMVRNPFPDINGDYDLSDSGAEYLLTRKATSSDLTIHMTKDLIITERQRSMPEGKFLVRPQFTKTARGNLLTGYFENNLWANGENMELDVRIQYTEVNGMQLPQRIRFTLDPHGHRPVEVEWIFSDYELSPVVQAR